MSPDGPHSEQREWGGTSKPLDLGAGHTFLPGFGSAQPGPLIGVSCVAALCTVSEWL